jgi:hypothetical protein
MISIILIIIIKKMKIKYYLKLKIKMDFIKRQGTPTEEKENNTQRTNFKLQLRTKSIQEIICLFVCLLGPDYPAHI